MGCFPACFGQLSRNLTTKKVQHQCLPPSNEQHESVKLLPEEKQELLKQEEQIINPIKLIMAESEDEQKEKKMDTGNEKNPFSDHSNLQKGASEVPSTSIDEPVENEKVEAERGENERGVGDESGSNVSIIQDFLINEKECAVEEESCSSLFSLSIDSRRQVFGAEMGGEREVSSLMKKTKNDASLENGGEKENVDMNKDPVIMEQRFEKSKPIETSLSTWLVESEKEMNGGSSSPESENNYGEDRQVLGVIYSNTDVKKVETISNGRINIGV